MPKYQNIITRPTPICCVFWNHNWNLHKFFLHPPAVFGSGLGLVFVFLWIMRLCGKFVMMTWIILIWILNSYFFLHIKSVFSHSDTKSKSHSTFVKISFIFIFGCHSILRMYPIWPESNTIVIMTRWWMIIMIFRRVQYGKTINQGLAPFNGHTSEKKIKGRPN